MSTHTNNGNKTYTDSALDLTAPPPPIPPKPLAQADIIAMAAITGTEGDDNLQGLDGETNTINGLGGDDRIYGGNLADTLYGGSGYDSIYGNAGDDTLTGGKYYDDLYGGAGADTYLFAKGDYQDYIDNYDTDGSTDVVQFIDLASTDVKQITRDFWPGYFNYLIVTFANGDYVEIINYFAGSDYRIDQFQFSDGVTWTYSDIKVKVLQATEGDDILIGNDGEISNLNGLGGNDYIAGANLADTLEGSNGADEIHGNAGDDTLNGGKDDDRLYGGAGDDIYVIGNGFGHDSLQEGDGGTDTVLLSNLKQSNVSFQKINSVDLLITVNATDETIVIPYEFDANTGYAIENFTFSNGTLTRDQVNALTDNATSGNDILWGGPGDDILNGKAGDDELHGLGGNDKLIGGTGNDSLYGGEGDDTYQFGAGLGNDLINEYDDQSGYGGADKLILSGLKQADVSFAKSGDTLIATIKSTGEKLTINAAFSSDTGYNIEKFTFPDGTLSLSDVNLLTLSGGAGDDTVWGWTGNDTLTGGAGDDVLYGLQGNDSLDGGTGNDTLKGGAGDDSYLFGAGSGDDTVTEVGNWYDFGGIGGNDQATFTGLKQTDVSFTKSGDTLIATIKSTGEKLSINGAFNPDTSYNIENYMFTDGTLSLSDVNVLTLSGGAGDDTVWGWTGNDTLTGGAGDDVLYGLQGNDSLDGGTGNDILKGGAGDDSYLFGAGSGDDTVTEVGNWYDFGGIGGNDQATFTGLKQTDVSFTKSGDTLIATIKSTGEKLSINGAFNPDTSYNIENFTFTDGTLSLSNVNALTNIGTSAADTLWGWYGADLLDGKGGDDTIYGGAGDDTYVFSIRSGKDTLNENGNGRGGVDLANFTNVKLTDLTNITRNGDDLVIAYGKNNQLTVQNQFSSDTSYQIEAFKFVGKGAELDNFVFGTVANDVLVGGKSHDVLNGLVGADTMGGGLGNDVYFINNKGDVVTEAVNAGTDTVLASISYSLADNVENLGLLAGAQTGTGNTLANSLVGNNAANTLIGLEGNDRLNGNKGADTLIGGLGNDSYVIDNIGDKVTEEAIAGVDTVMASISYNLGDNLENLSLIGKAMSGTGNAVNNILNGNGAANSLFGLAGADTLTGGKGADVLTGGLGKDKIVLSETTAASDKVVVAAGDSPVNAYDTVTDFALGNGTTTVTADQLAFSGVLIAADTVGTDGVNYGLIRSHAITHGLVSFDDADAFSSGLVLAANKVTPAFKYLQANFTGGESLVFQAAGNSYVFHDDVAGDTLVQLTGVLASGLNTDGLSAGGVWLV